MDQLPIELDDQDEPSVLAIKQRGLSVCAVIAEMDKERGDILTSAFRKNGAGDTLRLYGWSWKVEDYLRLTVGDNSIGNHCDYYSFLSITFLDPITGNMFFRHVENEWLLFLGTEAFVSSCLKIISQPIAEEAALVAKEQFLRENGIATINAFLEKYNRLPSFVGPGR